jgi:hypothetical protein
LSPSRYRSNTRSRRSLATSMTFGRLESVARIIGKSAPSEAAA